MNQTETKTEEDMTEDSELTVFNPTEKEHPKSEFTRPEYEFKGVKLFPFTYGYELLFNQVRDPEDTGLFTWLAFVFLLRLRNGSETCQDHRKWAIGLCLRIESFRSA